MGTYKTLFAFLAAIVISTVAIPQPAQRIVGVNSASQQTAAALSGQSDSANARSESSVKSTPLDMAINRIIEREHNQVLLFLQFKPIVETYIQDTQPDKEMGLVPYRDYYLLGQADLSTGVVDHSMLPEKIGFRSKFWWLFGSFGPYEPQGFLEMIYVDRKYFDKDHFKFQYQGKTFLGDVRCLVFDLTPNLKAKGPFHATFMGRIWVEDRDYTIVRFNGLYVGKHHGFFQYYAHFDSWRMNLQPGVWLPAGIFTEETGQKNPDMDSVLRFKAQTRFWGYNLRTVGHESEFSDLTIEAPTPVLDDSTEQEHDRSPVQAEREWQRESAENVVDTMQRTGLIAPPGPVDKVLDTVLNNLIVTNNLNLDPDPHCRVLLTSNIELFSIGHTIVISRGLLDVLPDEASLAVMLAQELADANIPKPGMDGYGFGDTFQVSTLDSVKRFSFQDSAADAEASGQKILELIRRSPYSAKLANAALFLEQLQRESKTLRALISPNLGNRVYPIPGLLASGPPLVPENVNQIAALPIGARIKLDPWNDGVEMLKSKAVPLQSPREKLAFEITPFMPYLTRYAEKNSTPSAQGPVAASGDK